LIGAAGLGKDTPAAGLAQAPLQDSLIFWLLRFKW
jgi:hypothetical protein